MDPGLSLDYVTTVLAALLVGTGFVLQQRAAAMEPASRFPSIRLIIDLFRKPRWLAGIGLLVAGDILAARSIGHLELSLVEPLLTTYLIFALVLAVPLSGHAFRLREVIGAVILVTGVALLSASRSAKPIGLSFGSVSHWPAAAGIAALAFILVEAGRRRPGRLRAALTGTAAGLVLGIQDALTRQTLEALQGNSVTVLFSTWPAYALAGAGALGIWLTQNAFSAGPLQASLPAISAGEPLIGILLGVIVFGDRIQISPGLLAIQAGGVAALVAGVVMVASDPALSQLREQASKPRRRPRYRQRRRYACCRRVRVNCSTACSTAAAHCPGDWGTMTCASCSTDASRYRSWLAPLPRGAVRVPVADAEMDKPAPAAQGGRGDRSRRHHPDCAQPTRRRLQRPRHRQHPHPRGARARLAIGRLAISAIRPAQRRGLAPYRGSALSTARARIVTRQQIEDYQAVIQRAVIPARPRSQSGRWRHPLAGQAEDQATGATARGRSSVLPRGLLDDLFAQVRAAPGRRPE